MTSHTDPTVIVLAALLLAFLGKTRPTLTLTGYIAHLVASLTCLAMLVKGKYKRAREAKNST